MSFLAVNSSPQAMESSANNPGITSLPVTDEKLDFKEMVVLYYVYHGFKPESIQILLSGKLRVRAGLPRTNDKDFDKYNAAFQQEIQDRTWQKFRDQNWAQTVTTMGQYLAQGQTDYEFADNLRLSKKISWISHIEKVDEKHDAHEWNSKLMEAAVARMSENRRLKGHVPLVLYNNA